MIALLLLGVIPVEIIPTADVDQVWFNEAYDANNGDLLFRQLIYWRWYGEGHRRDAFHVNPRHGFERDHARKRWFRYSIGKDGVLVKSVTKSYSKGPSIGDPEYMDSDRLGKDDRPGPVFMPPLEGRAYELRHP